MLKNNRKNIYQKKFNVSLDELLSKDEILEIANLENQNNISKHNNLLFLY